MNIETIWKHIQSFEGQVFKTVRGVEYTYLVYDNYLLINDDKRRKITKDSLITALTITNPTPSKIQRKNIWGPSYVYGIITDKRIKGF
jgi:hypothetical protein